MTNDKTVKMAEARRCQRLLFRSWHRGTRELDLLLGSFADAHLSNFTDEQLDRYETLLSLSDPDLFGWIAGQEAVPELHHHDVMRLLQDHARNKKCVIPAKAGI